jgi:hypothetical protein
MKLRKPLSGRFELDLNRDFDSLFTMELRDADKQEFAASRGAPWVNNFPIFDCIHLSDQVFVYYDAGRIIMVGGVVHGGRIWAVGTNEVQRVGRAISAESAATFKEWSRAYPRLWGLIDKRNSTHAAWLRRFGFTFEPDPVLINDMEFAHFWKENRYV